MDRLFDKVLVRPPGTTYEDCLSKNPAKSNIDVVEAKNQHSNYVKTLRQNGVEVLELQPLDKFPDSIFMQDAAFVGEHSKKAFICRFGVSERRGEENSVAEYLKKLGFKIERTRSPGTIEGGDILVTDKDTIFIGISERTNERGIDQLSETFSQEEIVKVPVEKVFHLLSAVNFLGNGTLAVCPELVDLKYFKDFELLKISKEEQKTRYTNKPINLLYLGNDKVLIPDVYPKTSDILEDAGYETIEVDISEFWKGDAGITCPMLPIYKGF